MSTLFRSQRARVIGWYGRQRKLQSLIAHGMLIAVMLTKISKKITIKFTQGFSLGLVALLLLGTFITVPFVRADQFDNQIRELQEENANNQEQANYLRAEAETYQNSIAQLQQQINETSQKIRANEAKRDDLKNQITQAEMELERQKQILGLNIKTMYLEGEITTLEMLATSKDLSEFVDKQQYRDSVQNKIKATLDKINSLKQQLTTQKAEVEGLIYELGQLQSQQAADRNKQAEMLAYTEAQKRNYEQQIKENSDKINELRAAQAALAAKLARGVFVSLGPVNKGDIIGTVGNTGYSTGPHLHLEARSSAGSLLDPLGLIRTNVWDYPVEPVSISQGFWEYNTWYISKHHPGVDFTGAGKPVRAVADGQVISRGCSADSSFFNGTRAYGYVVVIQHPDGKFSVYAHMNPPSSGYEHCSSSYGF